MDIDKVEELLKNNEDDKLNKRNELQFIRLLSFLLSINFIFNIIKIIINRKNMKNL